MIKLVATDIDGTLIRESTGQIYPEILDEIRRLTDQGVLFAVASGRQYASVRRMFADVSDRIIYIVENGAHIRYQERDLSLVEMRRDYVERLIRQLRELEDCEILVSTPRGSLLESKNEEFIDLMINGYHNDIQVVDDLLAQKEPVIKIAVYHKGSIRKLGENVLIPAWKDKVKACMAGEDWVDFMELSVDKGNALQMIQRQFGITRPETMAFGDNSNDLGLMLAAGEGYAVENARPEIKEAAKYICPSWEEKGVWQIVRQVENRAQEGSGMLYVSLLGGFKLYLNGEEVVLDKNTASKPMQLLQMLLYAGEDGVNRELLQDALYDPGKVTDRTSNLKQTVFRLRRMLKESGILSGQSIEVHQRSYYWGGPLALSVDAVEFEERLELAAQAKEEKHKLRYLKEACNLYQGDFLPRLIDEGWAVQERNRLKTVYENGLRELCAILKKQKRYGEIIEFSAKGLRLYPRDGLELEYLDGLIALDRFKEAQDFFKKISGYCTDELHNNLSEELKERQDILSARLLNTTGKIEDIKRELTEECENISETFYCTYPNFTGICQQLVRNDREKDEHASLLLCTMMNEKKGTMLSEKSQDALSEKLFAAIRRCLRRSDCYTRYSSNQFLILLVDCDLENVVYARKRIEFYLEEVYGVKKGVKYDAIALK